MIKQISFLILSICLLYGCAGDTEDPRLIHISHIVSSSPKEALEALDSIDCSSLSSKDRHLHDFLSVKARDKAYIKHESDSLILDVVTFYKGERLYVEAIGDNSALWSGIEREVVTSSPHFKEHLLLLAGCRLKEQDYRVALLIRCGITPSQMTVLLGRTKGTISYRRRHLCGLIMGGSVDSQSIDSIIRCI